MRMVFGLVLVVGLALAGFAVYMAQGFISQTQYALDAERAISAKSGPLVEVFVVNKPLNYGDVLTKVDVGQILRFHEENGSDLTMCVRDYEFTVPFGVVEASGRHVTGIVEKPAHHFFVNAGIYVLSPHVVSQVGKNIRLDMPDLAQDLIESGRDVSIFPIHEYWLDIGRPDDFLRAQEHF